ncbi:MAG: segregation/condensation protein A [Phycisphaeraceae bacterium]|nr:segregation/condensation protein A [Phycisphaeraceae bacterium]
MPLQDDYRVRLASFEGPLDLLLFLVRRHEVDINDIPIHTLTEQYLAFLKEIDEVDVDLAGEFLVMAATLVEIKSRTLSPRGVSGDGSADETGLDAPESEDPRTELVRQLIEYQKYRGAAEDLDRLRQDHLARAEASGGALPGLSPDEDPPIDVEDAHVLDLLKAYERIIAAVDFTRLGEHRVEYDDTPISLYAADLEDQLTRLPGKRTTIVELFRGRRRSEMIGLFLALLELVRNQRIRVEQPRPSDALQLELVDA